MASRGNSPQATARPPEAWNRAIFPATPVANCQLAIATNFSRVIS
jgi:hypothetical protein